VILTPEILAGKSTLGLDFLNQYFSCLGPAGAILSDKIKSSLAYAQSRLTIFLYTLIWEIRLLLGPLECVSK
jgi:hypothetical protein